MRDKELPPDDITHILSPLEVLCSLLRAHEADVVQKAECVLQAVRCLEYTCKLSQEEINTSDKESKDKV